MSSDQTRLLLAHKDLETAQELKMSSSKTPWGFFFFGMFVTLVLVGGVHMFVGGSSLVAPMSVRSLAAEPVVEVTAEDIERFLAEDEDEDSDVEPEDTEDSDDEEADSEDDEADMEDPEGRMLPRCRGSCKKRKARSKKAKKVCHQEGYTTMVPHAINTLSGAYKPKDWKKFYCCAPASGTPSGSKQYTYSRGGTCNNGVGRCYYPRHATCTKSSIAV